jgi:hypothetical protein
MKRKSESVHLLSILIGGLAAISWFLLVFIRSGEFAEFKGGWEWLFFLVSIVVCFFLPFILIRSIYWIVIGFKQDKTESGAKDKNAATGYGQR